MPKKKHKPEEIVGKLRQADVLISQGQDIADVIRQIGVSEVKAPPKGPKDIGSHEDGIVANLAAIMVAEKQHSRRNPSGINT